MSFDAAIVENEKRGLSRWLSSWRDKTSSSIRQKFYSLQNRRRKVLKILWKTNVVMSSSLEKISERGWELLSGSEHTWLAVSFQLFPRVVKMTIILGTRTTSPSLLKHFHRGVRRVNMERYRNHMVMCSRERTPLFVTEYCIYVSSLYMLYKKASHSCHPYFFLK